MAAWVILSNWWLELSPPITVVVRHDLSLIWGRWIGEANGSHLGFDCCAVDDTWLNVRVINIEFYPLFDFKFNLQYTEEFRCNVDDTWPEVSFNQRCRVHVYPTYIYWGCSSQWFLHLHSTVKQRIFCDCISTWWFQRWINPFSYKLTGATILQRKFNVESTLMCHSSELNILKQKINVDSRLILSS